MRIGNASSIEPRLGEATSISPKTVDAHRNSITKNIEMDSVWVGMKAIRSVSKSTDATG
jgi:hypothetical protein